MNEPIRCILLDDELPSLDYLQLLCSNIEGVKVVKCFTSSFDLLNSVKALSFDACILDIDMPGISGLQLAQVLSGKPVIFVSGHSEFAADAFECDAIDFVRKPINKERLEKAINKLRKHLSEQKPQNKLITVNTAKGKSVLSPDEIILITTCNDEKRDKIVFLQNGEQHTLKNITINDLLNKLPQGEFAQINKREIVSVKAIRLLNQDEITLKINTPNEKPHIVYLSEVYKLNLLMLLAP